MSTYLSHVEPGDFIEYTYDAWDPETKAPVATTVVGIVMPIKTGMMRLGNEGIVVRAIRTGKEYTFSRNALVTVLGVD